MQGYHFPPSEAEPSYGYNNQQVLVPQQWGQQGDARAYELNYQAYSAADTGPFQQTAQHQQQGYAETDADYAEEFYEDEEPRRGRRWFLIAAALVGAIGVGGALAYTYRSLIAPHSGRVPLVKAEPNVKVKPEHRGGREFAGAETKVPVRLPEGTPTQRAAAEPGAQEEPPTENLGPRAVKTIPITPGGAPPAQVVAPSIPGITLYQPPQAQSPDPVVAPVQAPPTQAQPKAAQSPPSERVAIGTRPPSSETDDDPPAGTSPVKRAPVQSAAAAHRLAPTKLKESPSSAGVGYVAVLSSQKTYLKALEIFADMRDQYGAVLGSKTPDVQEADLSARGLGTMYRLVVGPPGSHNAASGVCAQLKTAGYEGCWVKEY